MSVSLLGLLLAQLPMLPSATAQVPVAANQEVVRSYEVRALPGQLDSFRVFNSNSPELVLEEGILLSTFPPTGKKSPEAHLNFPLEGRFDIFAHHVSRSRLTEQRGPLYLGILLHNPTSRPIRLLTLQATSYLNDQAPFIDLPTQADNRSGRVFSGPGSRAMSDVLRRQRQSGWDIAVTLEPGQSHLLVNLPIAEQAGTARSTWMRLLSNGKLYAASLAKFGRPDGQGGFQAPQLSDWVALLAHGDLARPRDRAPTPLNTNQGEFIYGRVAGISQGSEWQTQVTDTASGHLNIPQPGQGIAYVINSLDRGTLGTGQVQSAEMLVRYPDTAYRAHGNYAVKYDLEIPLHNPTPEPRQVTLAIQTPIKEDRLSQGGLRFLPKTDGGPVFFRGTVRVRYADATGQEQNRFVHLVQRRGQIGEPLLTLTVPPHQTQTVRVEMLYPPDATPPQVLTIRTLEEGLRSER